MEPRQPIGALPRKLTIDVRRIRRGSVLRVSGDLDLHSAGELRDALEEQPAVGADEQPTRLVVDLNAVTFIDSMALGVLVASLKRLRSAGGTFELVCGKDRLLRLFRITRLDRTFEIHSDPGSAVS